MCSVAACTGGSSPALSSPPASMSSSGVLDNGSGITISYTVEPPPPYRAGQKVLVTATFTDPDADTSRCSTLYATTAGPTSPPTTAPFGTTCFAAFPSCASPESAPAIAAATVTTTFALEQGYGDLPGTIDVAVNSLSGNGCDQGSSSFSGSITLRFAQ
jgi:hypothetical protein